jgi:NAD(P)H-nitrite reductase large subunit
MRIAIVGNGVAGIEAALAVRRGDRSAEITVLSEESEHFFSRTALMYVLAGQLGLREIEPYERDLYRREGLRRVRARAIGLDGARRRVLLAGDPGGLAYDRLLIACGSRPRPAPWPGATLRGVGHFVTLQDLAWLEDELHGGGGAALAISADPSGSPYVRREAAARRRGRRPERAVVIGGGLIGAEVVETLVAAGVATEFLVREEWFWPIALDRREAGWIAEAFRAHGVNVFLDRSVLTLEAAGDGGIGAVRTVAGDHPADLVVVAIGVVPNTGWLAESGIALEADGGIVVDAGLATSLPEVFAAGDCAAISGPDGRRRPEQLWYTARDQGRIAGRRLLGQEARYDRGIPYNSAKLMDVEYTTVGRVDAGDGIRSWRFEERGPVRSSTRLVVGPQDRLVGANLLGRRWDHSVLARWIAEQRPLERVLAELGSAGFDTELVPRLAIPRDHPGFASPEEP